MIKMFVKNVMMGTLFLAANVCNAELVFQTAHYVITLLFVWHVIMIIMCSILKLNACLVPSMAVRSAPIA
jgi:hypothetical protein